MGGSSAGGCSAGGASVAVPLAQATSSKPNTTNMVTINQRVLFILNLLQKGFLNVSY
jgi:hypothetical protein